MAYEKQNFTDGQTLKAEHLTHIEDGIAAVEEAVSGMIDDTSVSKKPWSSKNTVDRLCPSFAESGAVVACEPVEGYPLTVQTDEGATNVIRCGKNLFGYDVIRGVKSNGSTELTAIESGVRVTATRDTSATIYSGGNCLPISALDGKKITISCTARKSAEEMLPRLMIVYRPADMSAVSTIKEIKTTEDVTPMTYTFTVDSTSEKATGCAFIGLNFYCNVDGSVKVGDFVDFADFQIEISDTATTFESYQGEEFGFGEPVPAIKGVNTIYADSGNITVTGKADPVAIINKLTNAIISLGGNV